MKTTLQKFTPGIAVLGLILISAPVAFAQSMVTTSTRTTSVGKVSEFSPTYISVTTPSSSLPIRYTASKTTTYVDENGNTVSRETVRSGAPVTVYYDKQGDELIASKVVVQKSTDVSSDGMTTTTQKTTTTEGTVSQFSPNAIAVKTTTSETPVSYTFSKTTTYVDENGNPVSVDVVKSGAPVTVFYDYEGGTPVATKVVVKSASSDPTLIQKKTTTTTTSQNKED